MSAKVWTVGEVRTLARQTVDGREAIKTARGKYFRALVETTQATLAGKADQSTQLLAVREVHRKFYPAIQDATTTADIAKSDKVALAERKRRALERNRRTNFARSAYGTIRRWLRAPGHDLMKLDPEKVTKNQLLKEAPPTRKHALTPERVRAKAHRLIDDLCGYAKQVAKLDQAQAAGIINEATERLIKLMAATGVAVHPKRHVQRSHPHRERAAA